MKPEPNLLAGAIQRAAAKLPSQADFDCGYKDVSIVDKAGVRHVVRLTIIMRSLGQEVLKRYAASEDPRDIIRAFTSKEHGSDAFLASLGPASLAELANTASILLLGPEALRNILQGKPISI